MSGRAHLIAAVLAILPVTAALASDRPFKSKYSQDEAGYWLETEFARLQERCAGIVGNKKNDKIPPLPPQFTLGTTPSLKSRVHPIEQVNLGKFFTYVWPENRISQVRTDDPTRFLRALPASLELGIRPESGISAFEYTQNCTGCALLNAAAGGGIGSINIRAALDAETNRNEEISVIYGTFYSPLQQLLGSSNPSARVTGLLAVWNFYARGAGIAKQPAGYYVAGLTGTVIATGLREERRIAGTAKSSVGVSVPLFSVNTAGDYEYSRQARTRVSDFLILAERGTANESEALKATLHELPTPEMIARDFADLPMEVENVSSQWRKGKDHVIELRMRGLPTEARDAGRWMLDLDDSDSVLVGVSGLRTTLNEDRDAQSDTAFPLRFTVSPGDALFRGEAGTFELNGRLVFRDIVKKPETRLTHAFSLTTNLAEAYVPSVPRNATTEVAVYGDSVKVVWKFEFALDDIVDVDMTKPVGLRILGVPCKEVGLERVVPEVPFDPNARLFKGTVELLLGSKSKYGQAASDFVTCAAMFEVTFTLRPKEGGKELKRALQVGLGLPRWR